MAIWGKFVFLAAEIGRNADFDSSEARAERARAKKGRVKLRVVMRGSPT